MSVNAPSKTHYLPLPRWTEVSKVYTEHYIGTIDKQEQTLSYTSPAASVDIFPLHFWSALRLAFSFSIT